MRSLFLTMMLPHGEGSGTEIVTRQVVDALGAAGAAPRVLGYQRPGDRGPVPPSEVSAGHRPIETSDAGLRALAWMAGALARGEPYSVAKYRSRLLRRSVVTELAERPDLLLVDHPHLRPAVPARLEVPLVFIAHNAEGSSYRRLSDAAGSRLGRWVHGREARLIETVELALATQARQVWTLSEEDAAFFRGRVPTADVRTLEVASRLRPAAPRSDGGDVGLIGSWTWRPNALGLRWFCEEVVPRLPPGLRIAVAGRGAEWLQGLYPNVSVHGLVPDAGAFLGSVRVVAVPAVAGTGLQIKTLDAVASGAPVVVTPVGARGLSELPPSVSVAEGAAAFAGAIAERVNREPERPDPAAVTWSRRRGERFTAAVAAWAAEAAAVPAPSASALAAG